jgi:hypothetical protein
MYTKISKPVASNFNGLAVWPDAQNCLNFANVTMPPAPRPNSGLAPRPHIWGATPCIKIIQAPGLETELEQLAMDVRRSPKPVLNAHPPDQGPQTGIDLRPASQGA